MKKGLLLLCVFTLLLFCQGCASEKDSDTLQSVNSEQEIFTESETEYETETADEESESGNETERETEIVSTTEEEEITPEQETETYLEEMTLEEKIAQMFIILPEALMEDVSTVTAAGSATKEAMDRIPVGGFIYLQPNLQSSSQVIEMLGNVQSFSMERIGLPAFLCLDEEGGSVSRIAGSGNFDIPAIEDMADLGARGSSEEAYETGVNIGTYLSNLGFNVDFAPVADVLSNPDNQVVKKRSFGEDPDLVSAMSLSIYEGLNSQGILGVYKHFPGHGATTADTHNGYAYSNKTAEELKTCELLPFQEGIDRGISCIMVGHISLPSVTGDDTPASLSPQLVTDLLRGEMGFQGIVVTDALNMGAVTQQYSSADAAVKAIEAGVDILLMPEDFQSAYYGVIAAVENERITQERIDESLRRILRVKLNL